MKCEHTRVCFDIKCMAPDHTLEACDITEPHVELNCMASEHTRVCFEINYVAPDHTLEHVEFKYLTR